ncbi:helix-turn-helix domain-containing protein [Streptomyces uncialis]|uniref:helix-turn-helix domain-containing protein n=1 Tax=Streptomyces uncialis TaxID=1048205 RepID=UPI00224E6810|nr:helix-turn-helix transcriptional regulator [Streptomyces uncialis]MCX4661518.1 helix-turn-helix transcriptional regulator [Streptomyces uncialis]
MSGRAPWTSVRLRAAWARQDWSAILIEYRRAAKLTQRDLEPLVGLPQPHIALIESGRRTVKSLKVKQRITEGLAVPDELRDMTTEPAAWGPVPDLRDRMAHAHRTGRVDLRTANWITTCLAEQRREEDEAGGLDLRPVVLAQLQSVTRLLPDASRDTADRLLLLAAEHAHWLSWVCWENGRPGPALSWLDLAAGWAADGGHSDMVSWVGRMRSYYALTHGDPVRALRTAEQARVVPVRSPAAAAVLAHQEAIAAAAVGDRDRARRLADEAQGGAARVPDAEDRPGWLYWLTPTRSDLQAAEVAYVLRDWSDAAALFRSSLPGLAAYPRDHAYYLTQMEEAERRV